MTDSEFLAMIPQIVRAEIAECVKRLPLGWWGDTSAELRLAEQRGTPGAMDHRMPYDSTGHVHVVETKLVRRRQSAGRKGA